MATRSWQQKLQSRQPSTKETLLVSVTRRVGSEVEGIQIACLSFAEI